jgi:hypothetical protein
MDDWSEREDQILEAMQRLKAESRRLIRQHDQLLKRFDELKRELEQIKIERQKRRGHGFLRNST